MIVETATAPVVAFGGYTIIAPGFSPEGFTKAIARAIDAGLIVSRTPSGATQVLNPRTRRTYMVTATGCSCPAGIHRSGCKHRALVLLLDQIEDRTPPQESRNPHDQTDAPNRSGEESPHDEPNHRPVLRSPSATGTGAGSPRP